MHLKEAKALFPFANLQREIRIIRSNVSDDHRIPAVAGKCIFVRRTVIFDKADLSACLLYTSSETDISYSSAMTSSCFHIHENKKHGGSTIC